MESSHRDDHDHEAELDSCTPSDVYTVLIEAKLNCSIRVLGSQLGLDPPDLDAIERESLDPPLKLLKVLEKCSERIMWGLTWSRIAEVLRKPALQQNRVANIIEEKHPRRNSSVSSSMILSPLSSTSSMDNPWSPSSPTHMDVDEAISIPSAVNMIRDDPDWEHLGGALGLSDVDIREIRQYDRMEHHQRLIERWHDRDIEFSWEKLQRAKEESKRRASYDSLSSIPSTPTSPTDDVQSQIKALDEKFRKLQTVARRELEVKHNSVELVEDELDSLPNNILKENHTFVVRFAKRTERFQNLKLFFLHLRAHCWNFLEYRILEILIENNCSDALREKMRGYVRDIQAFKDRTRVSEFINSAADLSLLEKATSVLKTFNKFTIEHDIDPDTHTLTELDAFRARSRHAVCKKYRLFECAIQVHGVRHKCIIVEWMVPEELTPSLRDYYYSQEGRELQLNHCVRMVLIDGKSVPTVVLIAAVNDKDREKIKAVLQDNDPHLDVNSSDEETRQTALLYTANCGDTEITEILVEMGADIHLTDKLQRSALIFASHEGHMKIVDLLLKKDAEPNHQDSRGWSALMLASYRGHVEVVELLLEYGSDVNLTTLQGWTALQRVCLYNLNRYPKAKHKVSERRGEIAKILIDHGTDIKKIDDQGRTALIAASDSGFEDIVKLLIVKISEFPDEERQKYLDHGNIFSWTALMSASEKGHTEAVRILIEAGASRSITKAKDEVSALHIAVQNGHVEVVEALTHKMDKDDLDARDNYGMTPLMLATKKRSEQLLNVLIHAGADVNAESKDDDQMTALMFAVKVGSFDVVKLLVENSANLFAQNSRKETVLEMAKNSSKDIRDYLSEKCKQAEEEQHRRKATAT